MLAHRKGSLRALRTRRGRGVTSVVIVVEVLVQEVVLRAKLL